jgi:predicted methyltransferase
MNTKLRTLFVLALLASCKPSADTAVPDQPAPDQRAAAPAVAPADFAEVLAMPHRSADNKSRDEWRHPAQTLAFFGVRKDATVVELWPGGGWYTEVLGPYLKGQGKLIVTVFDPNGPKEYYGTDQSKKMLERLDNEKDVLGEVGHVVVPVKIELGPDGKMKSLQIQPFELGPENSADVVLTFRNSHGWYRNDALSTVYGAAFKVLKPGGIFGVEQHRAAADADPNQTAEKGYLPEKTVIDAAQAVGFELVEKSEVNGNPKDTRDHPQGVWSLPPSLDGEEKDKSKYIAIGESDRMTLKFRKPG